MIHFTKLQKHIQDYDSERENLIKKSRDVLKLTKQVIYAVHRDEMKEAAVLLKRMETEKKELDVIAGKNPRLECEGSYKVAVQEFVEAALYFSFVKKGKGAEVSKIKDEVDQMYGELLKFDFRDNETRRKVDAVKYELRKLEDLVLDLKLKGR